MFSGVTVGTVSRKTLERNKFGMEFGSDEPHLVCEHPSFPILMQVYSRSLAVNGGGGGLI